MQTKQQKLYILNTNFSGRNYRMCPKHIMKQLRTVERTFPSEARKLEWDFYSHLNQWVLIFWDNGHGTAKFLINHVLPCIEHFNYKEEQSRHPKVVIFINK